MIERIRLGPAAYYTRQDTERLITEHKHSLSPEAVSLEDEKRKEQELTDQQGESSHKPPLQKEPKPGVRTDGLGQALDVVV